MAIALMTTSSAITNVTSRSVKAGETSRVVRLKIHLAA
jgi:hypothetical protein